MYLALYLDKDIGGLRIFIWPIYLGKKNSRLKVIMYLALYFDSLKRL
jgi:hypothetical protein